MGGTSATAFNNITATNNSRVIIPNTNIPTVSGVFTVTAGSALKQTQTVSNATVSFLQISTNKYRGVDITTINNLSSTTVVITTTTSGGCTTNPASVYAMRCYTITPTTDGAATVKLWALATELNGITTTNLAPYRYNGGIWNKLTNVVTGTDGGNYSFSQGYTLGFSHFLLGDTNTSPTAVTLNRFSAHSDYAPIGWLLAVAGFSILGGALITRRQKHFQVHQQ